MGYTRCIMNNNQTYEKVIAAASESKTKRNKALAIIGYSIFFAVWILIGIFNPTIIIPLALTGVLCTLALILLSWKYIEVEYEYALWYGSFEVAKIYGKKSRKNLISTELRELLLVAPASEEYLKKAEHFELDKRINAVSSDGSDNEWILVTGGKDEPRILVRFEADDRLLSLLRAANPGVFVRKI